MSRIDDMKYVLADLFIDLAAASTMYRDYFSNNEYDPDNCYHISIQRLCVNQVVIGLAKLDEFYRHYGKEIKSFPDDLRDMTSKIRSVIEKKKIYEFRSKYVAHLFDNDYGPKRPILAKDGLQYQKMIIGETHGDLVKFFEWVYPDSEGNDVSVIDYIEQMKKHCIVLVGTGIRP